MNHHDDIEERYADLLGAQSTPAVKRLVRALDAVCAPPASPRAPQLDAAMARVLQARTTVLRHTATARKHRSLMGMRLRLVSLVAALLLALSGVAGYLRLAGPTPAAAQTMRILHRAAAALHLSPNQAAHVAYSVTVTVGGIADPSGKAAGGLTGTADVWIQADASGAPTLSAQTLTMDKPGMTSRYIQMGQQVYAYNPEMRGDNTIMLAPEARGHASWLVPNDVFDAASATQELSTLATQSPQRVQLLPQQTLDGHTVDVIEVDGWTNRPAQRTTFYFDAQSYVLRGFDATSQDPSYPMPSWQVRLRSYATMPAADVPPHTFTLNAPATARVQLPDLGDPAAVQTLETAVTATCHSTAHLKALLVGGQSVLAACQATAPGVTQAGLVAALAAPYQASLDAAAAAGQITPAQQADSLAAVQAWLETWVTTPGGRSK
jgi:hypothetical protein